MMASRRTARNLVVGEQDAPLQRKSADGLAVIGVKLGHDDRAIIFERVNFRQVARVNEQQADGSAQRNRADHQEGKRSRPSSVPPPIFIVAR